MLRRISTGGLYRPVSGRIQGRFAGPASRNGGFLVVRSQGRADHTVANRHDSIEFLRFFLIDGHKVGKPYRLSLVTQSNRRCGIKLIRGYWLNRFRKPILEGGFELLLPTKVDSSLILKSIFLLMRNLARSATIFALVMSADSPDFPDEKAQAWHLFEDSRKP